ncbi:hypothetical protein ACI3PL_29695, partial [Lacticaseibacillus paracasei]
RCQPNLIRQEMAAFATKRHCVDRDAQGRVAGGGSMSVLIGAGAIALIFFAITFGIGAAFLLVAWIAKKVGIV